MQSVAITCKLHESPLHHLSEFAAAHLKDSSIPYRTPSFLAHPTAYVDVDAPDDVDLAVALVLHVPADVTFTGDTYEASDPDVTVLVTVQQDLPEHAPEARGHKVGSHGHTDPQMDITVSAGDAKSYNVTAKAHLHPMAICPPVTGTTGTAIHLEQPPTDPADNG